VTHVNRTPYLLSHAPLVCFGRQAAALDSAALHPPARAMRILCVSGASTASLNTRPSPIRRQRKKDVVWLALNDDRPLMAFAGMWTKFKGDRGTKSKPYLALTTFSDF
jgi:hypothetical protein